MMRSDQNSEKLLFTPTATSRPRQVSTPTAQKHLHSVRQPSGLRTEYFDNSSVESPRNSSKELLNDQSKQSPRKFGNDTFPMDSFQTELSDISALPRAPLSAANSNTLVMRPPKHKPSHSSSLYQSQNTSTLPLRKEEEKLKEQEGEIVALKLKIFMMQKKMSGELGWETIDLEVKYRLLQERCEELEKTVEQLTVENEKLKNQQSLNSLSMSSPRASIHSKNGSAELELSKANKEIQRLNSLVSDLQFENRGLKGDLLANDNLSRTGSASSGTTSAREVSRLTEEITSLNSLLKRLQNDKESMASDNDHLKVTNENLRRETESLKSELEEAKNMAKSREYELMIASQNHKEELQSNNDRIAALERVNENYEKQQSNLLKTKSDNVKQVMETEQAKYEEMRKSMMAANERTETKAASLERERDSLKQEVNSLKETIENLEDDVAILQCENEDLIAASKGRDHELDKNSKAERELAVARGDYDALLKDFEATGAELGRLRKDLTRAQRELGASEEQLFACQSDLRKSKQECQLLRDREEQRDNEFAQKLGQESDTKAELFKYKSDASAAMARNSALQEEMETLRARLRDLESNLHAKTDNVEKLREDLTVSEEKYARYKRQVKDRLKDIQAQHLNILKKQDKRETELRRQLKAQSLRRRRLLAMKEFYIKQIESHSRSDRWQVNKLKDANLCDELPIKRSFQGVATMVLASIRLRKLAQL